MSHYELESHDYKFRIYIKNLAGIKKVDVDRISCAWAKNYHIYLSIFDEGINSYFEIASSRMHFEHAFDIRKEWHDYSLLLKTEPPQIPIDWFNYLKNI